MRRADEWPRTSDATFRSRAACRWYMRPSLQSVLAKVLCRRLTQEGRPNDARTRDSSQRGTITGRGITASAVWWADRKAHTDGDVGIGTGRLHAAAANIGSDTGGWTGAACNAQDGT